MSANKMSSSSNTSTTCADKIYNFFNDPLVVMTMSTLLIIDILCVILGISFDLQYLDSEVDDYEDVVASCQQEIQQPTSAGINACDPDDMGKDFYERAGRFVYWVSIVILSIFVLESLILFVAKPLNFFMNKGRMLDFVVVVVALTLELVFADTNIGGIVVVGRLWRFIRIGHGVYDESKECETCQENGKMIYQLDSLNESRAIIKAYEMMLAGGGPETVDTELMDNLLHIVGGHLKAQEELALEMLKEEGEDISEYSPPPVNRKSNVFPISMGSRGGEDLYTRM